MNLSSFRFAALSSLMLAVMSQPAWALRCGTYLIDVGLQKVEVLDRCGPPASQDIKTERRIVRQLVGPPQNRVIYDREIQVATDEWVYNFGPTQFMQLLVFEDGRLIKITDLGYGR
jgi:hypothetical protein